MVQSAGEMKLLAELGELLQSCVSLEEARHLTEPCLQNLFPRDSRIGYLNREFGGLAEIFANGTPEIWSPRKRLNLGSVGGYAATVAPGSRREFRNQMRSPFECQGWRNNLRPNDGTRAAHPASTLGLDGSNTA
jgi:hypothetical protein